MIRFDKTTRSSGHARRVCRRLSRQKSCTTCWRK